MPAREAGDRDVERQRQLQRRPVQQKQQQRERIGKQQHEQQRRSEEQQRQRQQHGKGEGDSGAASSTASTASAFEGQLPGSCPAPGGAAPSQPRPLLEPASWLLQAAVLVALTGIMLAGLLTVLEVELGPDGLLAGGKLARALAGGGGSSSRSAHAWL